MCWVGEIYLRNAIMNEKLILINCFFVLKIKIINFVQLTQSGKNPFLYS